MKQPSDHRCAKIIISGFTYRKKLFPHSCLRVTSNVVDTLRFDSRC